MGEDGIVQHNDHILSCEARSIGQVILSWENIKQDLQGVHLGNNAIIHEIAHKLDILDGGANGMPPLHTSIAIPEWT